MTTGRINQIAFYQAAPPPQKERGKELHEKGTYLPIGGRPSRPRHEWSPTSNALDPFTGVCSFECRKQIPRDGQMKRYEMSLCTPGRPQDGCSSATTLGHIRLWPDCSSRKETQLVTKCATLYHPKASSPHTTRKGGGKRCFRTRGTFELEPKRCTVS